MESNNKEVARSSLFYSDIQEIYLYGMETFGERLADFFFEEILHLVSDLRFQYLLHPECRFIETKTKEYRNIILGSYLIIYRITPNRIEVLRAFHSSRSPKTITTARNITID